MLIDSMEPFALIPGLSGQRETIAISDNSPRKGAALLHQHHGVDGQSGAADTVSQPVPEGSKNSIQTREARLGLGLRQAFPSLIPDKPYCADSLSDGLAIRERKSALRCRLVQFNGPATFSWLLHDIDHAGAHFAHRDANVPEPNVIAINPENGHGHSAVLLAAPVARHSASRLKPLQFYAAVERGIGRRIDADRQYSGLIVKNPLHADWRVEWRREEPYTLAELADWLFYEDMRPQPAAQMTFGAGRNCTIFDELRTIAYREVREFKHTGQSEEAFRARLERVALGINLQFPVALKLGEVRAIAKSVAKWTWRRFSREKFSARQALLGARRAAQMWAGHVSAESTKPWLGEGVSRATWYRRRKERRAR